MPASFPSQAASHLRFPGIFSLVFFFLATGCAPQYPEISIADNLPVFQDDGNAASLKTALQRHQEFLNSLTKDAGFTVDGMNYTNAEQREALKVFAEIIALDLDPTRRDQLIKETFDVYQADGRDGCRDKRMLVTGYFEPVLQGSLLKKAPFLYPLYTLPADLVIRMDASGKKHTGRVTPDDGKHITPYWTRKEIETGEHLQGYELVYLKDRFDAFLLHVQGSGRIQLRNGEIRAIQYRGNNGHPYASIGKLLVEENKLTLEEAGIPAIRNYLRSHPEELSRVLNHNPRYIFFGWAGNETPRGSTGTALTAGRSVAIDGGALPMGMIGYLETRRPVLDENGIISGWKPLQRFVLPQDTGAAIKGPGRVDFFWGAGEYAELAAGVMREKGKLYFLIKKKQAKEE